MDSSAKTLFGKRVDAFTLEADLAFFEARLSFAGEAADTVYQRAQIKAYRALGTQLGATLESIRKPRA
jgi:hypothetical protein